MQSSRRPASLSNCSYQITKSLLSKLPKNHPKNEIPKFITCFQCRLVATKILLEHYQHNRIMCRALGIKRTLQLLASNHKSSSANQANHQLLNKHLLMPWPLFSLLICPLKTWLAIVKRNKKALDQAWLKYPNVRRGRSQLTLFCSRKNKLNLLPKNC